MSPTDTTAPDPVHSRKRTQCSANTEENPKLIVAENSDYYDAVRRPDDRKPLIPQDSAYTAEPSAPARARATAPTNPPFEGDRY